MDQQEFDRIVSEDVKNILSSEKQDYLRIASNLERWKKSLLKLLDNLDEQVAELAHSEAVVTEALPTDLITTYKIDADEKKTKIGRFRFYVTQRLSEVERMLALGEDGQEEDLRLASFYRNAILEHRTIMEEHDIESSPVDHALWNSIDGVWSFVDLDQKLSKWN